MQALPDAAKLEPHPTDEISTDSIWGTHDKYVFQSNKVGYIDNFYPIYQYKDLFSFSILPLILAKGSLRLNDDFTRMAFQGQRDVAAPNPTIDMDIRRLGGPRRFTREIVDRDEFAERLALAMADDINAMCKRHPDHQHVIFCGGRDSLNLLLHDWTSKPIVYSARPNFDLVKEFIYNNKLDYEVHELYDKKPENGIDREIIESSCLVNLKNWKWTTHIREIAEYYDHNVIFWKGQVADAFFTDYWKSYTSSQNSFYRFYRKALRKLTNQQKLYRGVIADHVIADFENSIWQRAAVGQGAHLGFLRSICDALFLSAYHGAKTTETIYSMSINDIANEDIRPLIGNKLLGRNVIYPASNPAPPISSFRDSIYNLQSYKAAMDRFGIEVV
jgi:hypothetical protein